MGNILSLLFSLTATRYNVTYRENTHSQTPEGICNPQRYCRICPYISIPFPHNSHIRTSALALPGIVDYHHHISSSHQPPPEAGGSRDTEEKQLSLSSTANILLEGDDPHTPAAAEHRPTSSFTERSTARGKNPTRRSTASRMH